MHPDFLPTPTQTAKLADLRTRLSDAIATTTMPTTRARYLRRGIDRIASTKDRALIAQWLHEWELGIEGELRTLTGAAAQRSAAA
jgi:hypothetical protein